MAQKSLRLLILGLIGLAACHTNQSSSYISLSGPAQGTSYSISCLPEDSTGLQAAVDSVLESIDQSLSTYRESSTISNFNRGDSFASEDPDFFYTLQSSLWVWKLSEGAFDPTVMPLVRAWGFGPEGVSAPAGNLDSLLLLVGLDKLQYDTLAWGKPYEVKKAYPEMQLDFNAIAPGYTVDLLASLLESRGAANYMVELGGEVIAKGVNPKGAPWRIGVDKPIEELENRELAAIINLSGMALATSGSYRKFYVRDGVKYSHTIDPRTGRPVDHPLLSVTVMAPNCVTADAFATAFMVMGEAQARALIARHPELEMEAYFITSDSAGNWQFSATAGMEAFMQALP